MGNRVQVLTAIEDFLYEVCLLTVFYPWYLFRLVVFPRATLGQFCDAVRSETDADLIVSPPLFLFISATIAVVFLPPVDLGSGRLFATFSRMVTGDAMLGKVLALCMPILLLAICAALLVEWRTPGGVTRQSFYLPLFMSILVASVLLIVTATANVAFTGTLKNNAGAALISLLAIIAGLGWYLYAQSQVFALLAGTSRLTGLALSLAAFGMNEALSMLLPQG